MRGNAHVRFGGRAGETHITRVAQGAPVRPYYFNVRLQKDRPCVLVVVGATEDGHKELLAIQDGERESHLSWLHLLQDLKARGLKEHSFLAGADGASGFWKALEEALPGARAQQCWVHKTAWGYPFNRSASRPPSVFGRRPPRPVCPWAFQARGMPSPFGRLGGRLPRPSAGNEILETHRLVGHGQLEHAIKHHAAAAGAAAIEAEHELVEVVAHVGTVGGPLMRSQQPPLGQ